MNNFIQFLTYFRIISGPIIFILIVILKLYGVACNPIQASPAFVTVKVHTVFSKLFASANMYTGHVAS